ncbi:MAG: hypothetical protein GC137_08705 [Alphaproteobacteria bacterium]|nr:hypothetical protein [Alphaproteobacteria bacterium]
MLKSFKRWELAEGGRHKEDTALFELHKQAQSLETPLGVVTATEMGIPVSLLRQMYNAEATPASEKRVITRAVKNHPASLTL